MSQHVPLDPLVVNLLAPAEAAPTLSPEALTRLATLATTLAPTVESLASINLEITTALLDQPAFTSARAAWDMLAPPERHGLTLDEVLKTLPNPTASPASSIEVLEAATKIILQEPQQATRNTTLLQRLAALLKQSWPPRGSAAAAAPAPTQPEGDRP